jgi:hypothetical protein
VVKKSSVGFNQQINQLGKSTAKKDLNSSNKIEDERLKSTEERAEPSKKTNVLTKQDSSKYLRAGSNIPNNSSQMPTQYSQASNSVLSNTKPNHAVSYMNSGSKVIGNKTNANVSSFQLTENDEQEPIQRDKSVSLSQMTKGITLKAKVSRKLLSPPEIMNLFQKIEDNINFCFI